MPISLQGEVRQLGSYCDYYHLRRENEDFGILLEAGSMIRYVHFAEVQSRSFPVVDNEYYGKFFDRLRSLRYDGRCSIEAYTQNLAPTACGRWKS